MTDVTRIEELTANRCFDGWNKQFRHASTSLHCNMRFGIYLPPQASDTNKVPVLYWLSGLTCTDENFMHKAGAQRVASANQIANLQIHDNVCPTYQFYFYKLLQTII